MLEAPPVEVVVEVNDAHPSCSYVDDSMVIEDTSMKIDFNFGDFFI